MSKQLRYLLHGNKEKYEDVETPLYTTSLESSKLWQKVGQQVLQIRGEEWRLLEPLLVQHIPQSTREILGIKPLQPQEVIDLIKELGADCLDGNLLEVSERYELLGYIRQLPINQDLWMALRLHEATNGQLVSIEEGKVYLENTNFPLDERIQEYVLLVRENKQKLDQDWIPRWNPDKAIKKILEFPNAQEYCDLILDTLQQIPIPEREALKKLLRDTKWLWNEVDRKAICPLDVLRLPEIFLPNESIINTLEKNKSCESSLPNFVKNHKSYSWIKNLFTFWSTKTIIDKIFSRPEKNFDYWSNFCTVVLDAIQDLVKEDLSLDQDLENLLKHEEWLLLEDRLISTQQIIEIVPKPIKTHLPILLELSDQEYVGLEDLPKKIKNHDSLRIIIINLSSQWYENEVIDFLLNQAQLHIHYNIILDALNSLFSHSESRLTDKNKENLKIKNWLVDNNPQASAILPENVLHYPDIDDEIKELLSLEVTPYITSSQLIEQVRNSQNCWQWLTKEVFLNQDTVLQEIGKILRHKPFYQLGEFEINEFPLSEVLSVFRNFTDLKFLPFWNFAQKLKVDNFKKYLLPNLLGRLQEKKLVKILEEIQNISLEEKSIKVFNSYLRLAVVNYKNFSTNILPKIKLLNRRGRWQNPNKLTWGNLDNIDDSYLLDNKQEDIIKLYLNSLNSRKTSTTSTTTTTAIDIDNYSVLKTYFQSWDCPGEPIGAFLSLLHVHGGEGNVKNLAHLYLGNRDLDDLRHRLLENRSIEERLFNIYVGQASNKNREVVSLLGETFTASLATNKNPPHLFVNQLTHDVIELELLPIDPQEFNLSELTDLLKKSIKIILQKVYQITDSSLEQIWQDLLKSDQLDIQIAKDYLLDYAPHVIRTLGVHEYSPGIKSILAKWDILRRRKGEFKQQNKAINHIDKQIEDLVIGLSNLLESESPESEKVREQVLQAVRNKIAENGYRLQSIPFELFQNADDAVIEWQGMSPKSILEDYRKQIIIVWTYKKLVFIHCGRPIGCFQHPDHPDIQYRDKGFDGDLEKMLTFNMSDKGQGVTGKFGLGFKSVYLACVRPYVLSKNLGFTVEGGLIPSRLRPEKRNELRKHSQKYINSIDATITELNLENNLSSREILEDFLPLIPILLVFSKGIKTCKLFNEHNQESTLACITSSVLGVSEIEICRYNTGISSQQALFLCLKTKGDAEATLLLRFIEENSCLHSELDKNTPTFWVTAPTRERLFLSFVLNTNFDITPGRESLVKSSDRNLNLAKSIGESLGKTLYDLFRASENNWEDLVQALSITTADEYEFWNFLWKELAVGWQDKDPSEGIEIIRLIFGGDRGMGYLINRCPCLPNGLYGSYRQLISLDHVKYKVTGKLLEPNCFLKVASWSRFNQTYKNQLIARKKWEEVEALLDSAFDKKRYKVKDLQLLDVLQNEIEGNEPKVAFEQSLYIGQLISKEFLNKFESSYELESLTNFLETVCFMSKAGSYVRCQQLLTDTSDSTIEETLLVGFAPDSNILHPSYRDTALNLFFACRSRRDSFSPSELASWVIQAQTEEQRKAVHLYLVKGEQRERLACILYANHENYWFRDQQYKDILDILELTCWMATEKAKVTGEDEIVISPIPDNRSEEAENYNPLFEIQTSCTYDDFDIQRSSSEFDNFTNLVIERLNLQNSPWKGYIYHFTHVENAVSILRSEKLQARKLCSNFSDSAGANLINNTRDAVKGFARFYFRPLTPTQWHNEGLGKRQGNIRALCPVPIFFRINLKRVLETHNSKCGISSGNLAASGSHYGNSVKFLEECFDFNNVYSTQVGTNDFLRASQQEFIVHHFLELTRLNLDDISIICRDAQDKETLLTLIGKHSKYSSRIFEEREISISNSLFFHHNPSVRVIKNGNLIEIQIARYDEYKNLIHGELVLNFIENLPLSREVSSMFRDISRVTLGDYINIRSSRCIQLQYKPNTLMSVYFQEDDKDWLIYTNDPQNH